MKIETADCIEAIIKHFLKMNVNSTSQLLNPIMWKRLSKSGSGDNIKRVFENKMTKTKIYVISSKEEILNVSLSEPIVKFSEFNVDLKTTLIKTLKKLAEDNSDIEEFEDFEYSGVYYNEKLKSIWLDVFDGLEEDEIIKKEFLKIDGVEHVIIEMEHSPNENDTDWVNIY